MLFPRISLGELPLLEIRWAQFRDVNISRRQRYLAWINKSLESKKLKIESDTWEPHPVDVSEGLTAIASEFEEHD